MTEIRSQRLDVSKKAGANPMIKKILIWLLATFFVATTSVAEAQQSAKIVRIVILTPDPISARAHLFEAFRQGLRDLGYTEGQNIKGRADAVLALPSGITAQRTQLANLAVKSRLPAISASVDVGGLMTYGVNIIDLFRRAATYVDKILKGAKPAELPVEQPTKFELVINLKTAKQIGLTIPPNVLARADKVIR
jgi:hypothetical protein